MDVDLLATDSTGWLNAALEVVNTPWEVLPSSSETSSAHAPPASQDVFLVEAITRLLRQSRDEAGDETAVEGRQLTAARQEHRRREKPPTNSRQERRAKDGEAKTNLDDSPTVLSKEQDAAATEGMATQHADGLLADEVLGDSDDNNGSSGEDAISANTATNMEEEDGDGDENNIELGEVTASATATLTAKAFSLVDPPFIVTGSLGLHSLLATKCNRCMSSVERQCMERVRSQLDILDPDPQAQVMPGSVGFSDFDDFTGPPAQRPPDMTQKEWDRREQKARSVRESYGDLVYGRPAWLLFTSDAALFARLCICLQMHIIHAHANDYRRRFVYRFDPEAERRDRQWRAMVEAHARRRELGQRMCEQCKTGRTCKIRACACYCHEVTRRNKWRINSGGICCDRAGSEGSIISD